MKSFWFLALVTMISACATSPTTPYKPPASGPTAKIQVRTSAPSFGTVAIFEEPRMCSVPRVLGQIGMGQFFRAQLADTSIPADGLVSVWLKTTLYAQCDVVMTFEAKSGRTYLLQAEDSIRACSLQISETSESGGPIRRVRWVGRTLDKPVFKDQYCKSENLEAELAKPPRRNLSRMTVDDIVDLLPATEGGRKP